MTKTPKHSAEDIQDQDLDQAQGGIWSGFDRTSSGGMVSVQIDHSHRVAIGGSDPFNTADGRATEDTIVDATGWAGSAPTPYP